MFGVPLDVCAHAMFRAVREVADKVSNLSLREVHLVNLDLETTQVIQSVFLQLDASDDDDDDDDDDDSAATEKIPLEQSSATAAEPQKTGSGGDTSPDSVEVKHEVEEDFSRRTATMQASDLESRQRDGDIPAAENRRHFQVAPPDARSSGVPADEELTSPTGFRVKDEGRKERREEREKFPLEKSPVAAEREEPVSVGNESPSSVAVKDEETANAQPRAVESPQNERDLLVNAAVEDRGQVAAPDVVPSGVPHAEKITTLSSLGVNDDKKDEDFCLQAAHLQPADLERQQSERDVTAEAVVEDRRYFRGAVPDTSAFGVARDGKSSTGEQTEGQETAAGQNQYCSRIASDTADDTTAPGQKDFLSGQSPVDENGETLLPEVDKGFSTPAAQSQAFYAGGGGRERKSPENDPLLVDEERQEVSSVENQTLEESTGDKDEVGEHAAEHFRWRRDVEPRLQMSMQQLSLDEYREDTPPTVELPPPPELPEEAGPASTLPAGEVRRSGGDREPFRSLPADTTFQADCAALDSE